MAGREPTVSDDEILAVFEEHEDTMLSTGEVAAELTIGHKGTLKRLKKLAADGRLRNKEFGNQIIWALPRDQ